jgi:hypothetical protein
MRANNDATYLADFDRVRGAIIDLVRTSADQWEFASAEAS